MRKEDLKRMARDENPTYRWVAARNSTTPPEVLAKLAADANADVRRAAARNLANR